MRRLVVVALVAVLAAGLVIWRLSGPGLVVGPVALGGTRPVTVGSCRVPAGPVAAVLSERRNSGAPGFDGVLRSIALYETAHGQQARSFSVVQVDGSGPDTDTISLRLGSRGAMVRNLRRMVEGQRATDPEADVLAALATAATEVRRAGGAGTVLLQDSGLSTAGALDLRRPPAEMPSGLPDLSGLTVILDGVGDVVAPQPPLPDRAAFRQRWTQIARAAGAACVALTGAQRTTAPRDAGLPPVSLVRF